MGFCNCINKLFLVVLNFIVFVVGVGVVALASIVIHRSSEYSEMFFDGILTLPVWTLIAGLIITLLGFFGCCGALRENRCMLYTYATVVLVLFIAEVTLGILCIIYPNEAQEKIKEGINDAFERYGTNDDSLDKAIDSMQHDLHCCGINNYKDWLSLPNGAVPRSCCKDQVNCDYSSVTPTGIYTEGCFNVIVGELKGVIMALGITAIVLAIVQIACICIACGLAKRREQYV